MKDGSKPEPRHDAAPAPRAAGYSLQPPKTQVSQTPRLLGGEKRIGNRDTSLLLPWLSSCCSPIKRRKNNLGALRRTKTFPAVINQYEHAERCGSDLQQLIFRK